MPEPKVDFGGRKYRFPAGGKTDDEGTILLAAVADLTQAQLISTFAAVQVQSNAMGAKLTVLQPTVDTGRFFTATVPQRLTVPVSGTYLVTVQVDWQANAAGSRMISIVRRDAADAILSGDRVSLSPGIVSTLATTQSQYGSYVLKANSGDYIEVFAYQDSGAARNIDEGGRITITRVGD